MNLQTKTMKMKLTKREKDIDAHTSNMLRKTGANNAVRLVMWAVENGELKIKKARVRLK